ncbi:MAG: prolipoprotein diacylglyceryl transferase [Candidatus Methylomirabilales bacterium]
MYPILLKIGSFELRSYGVVIALAILAAYLLGRREAARRRMDPRLVEDFAFFAILFGILGARLYYIAFFDPGMFLRQPHMVLAVWKGGLAIHGALLGGLLTGIWFCRKHGISFWIFADTLTPALILGQAIGRLACFLNGDAYGIPTTVPWAVTFTDPNALAPLGVPRHPTQLYEMGLDLVLFGLLWALRRRRLLPGQLFLLYAGGYGVIRFIVETFRADQLQFAGGVSAAQTLSVLVLVGSLLAFTVLRRRLGHKEVGSRHKRSVP